MSIYHLPIIPNDDAFGPISWDEVIESDTIDLIKQSIYPIPSEFGGIVRDSTPEDNLEIRRVKTRIVELNEFKWIFDLVSPYVTSANFDYFKYDIHGFLEQMQYLHYGEDIKGGHYNWHMDCGPGIATRKLTVIVQLSDPIEYTGCDVEIFSHGIIDKRKGSVTVFPAWMQHRVTELTSGNRDSLVAWVNGPTFR